jgi:hypothetical protein
MLLLDVGGLASLLFESGREIAVKGFAEIVVAILSPIPLAWRYFDTLLGYSANPRGSEEHLRYKALRFGLVSSCRPLQIYTKLLKKTLDKIDWLFGDVPGKAVPNLGTRLFGLTNPAYVWTVASLDRCLLFALFYPMLTVSVIWAVYNESGVAGAALFFPTTNPGYQRGIALAMMFLAVGGIIVAKRRVALMSLAVAFIVAVIIGANSGAAIIAALGVLILGTGDAARSGVVTVACFVAIALALSVSGLFHPSIAGTGPLIAGLAGAIAGALSIGVAKAYQHAKRIGHHPIFLPTFILVALVLIYELVWLLAPHMSLEAWRRTGALLLIFGVLTLLNAPFDFLSLGLTRGFLRRGLEKKGLSPIWFAFYDAASALVIISALACVLILAVQLFGALEILGHQHRTLDLKDAFYAIQTNPSAPQNFWIYALLITTQAPSLFNVAVGAISVARAFRPLSEFIHRRLPDGKPILSADKIWIVPLLIVRSVLPAAAGILAGLTALLAVPLWFLPLIDFDIVEQVRRLVEADLPARWVGI